MVVIIAKYNDTIVAGHTAQCVGIRSGRPLLRGGRAIIAVAVAAAIVGIFGRTAAAVRVEE